jgi:integrase/recombinase XerD
MRAFQVFEGHKKPGPTERYRRTGLEELKAAVLKYHPLKCARLQRVRKRR